MLSKTIRLISYFKSLKSHKCTELPLPAVRPLASNFPSGENAITVDQGSTLNVTFDCPVCRSQSLMLHLSVSEIAVAINLPFGANAADFPGNVHFNF